MKLLAIVALLISLSVATKWYQINQNYGFSSYKQEFGKAYESDFEHAQRKIVFESNMRKIREHNAKDTTWKLGVNHLTDRFESELNQIKGINKAMLYKSKLDTSKVLNTKVSAQELQSLPTAVDWREKGIITAVKDQGGCGSCWAFSAAETIESHAALNLNQFHQLSEQNILDCTENPKHCGGTGGCEGATVELGFEQIISTGIASEWTYPYVSYHGKDFKCDIQAPSVVHFDDYVTLPQNEYEPLLKAVGTEGPISISVDASTWHLYESGVFDGCNQTNPDIDHAVQLVGYGTDDKLGPYWLVRNSWSPVWGEQGYIRLARPEQKRCGIDLTPDHGDGCDGGPPTVDVCGTCGILYDSVYPINFH
eukprot:TRINITY_DN9784_c0_g1_i1.p1 TRINITY_DN9784_c0_g1~~TRINITY_DN9784_c0_g1_i1.p1  ORF type:complete len:366 (+),score=91.99 TRINITY_DN9784_c0_g1_i1:34-1131(+)